MMIGIVQESPCLQPVATFLKRTQDILCQSEINNPKIRGSGEKGREIVIAHKMGSKPRHGTAYDAFVVGIIIYLLFPASLGLLQA